MEEYLNMLLAILGTGTVTTLINYFLFRRKHEIETNKQQTELKVSEFSGLKERTKDQDELITLLSEELKNAMKDASLMSVEFYKETTKLQKNLHRKDNELIELANKYNEKIKTLELKILKIAKELEEAKADTKNLSVQIVKFLGENNNEKRTE